jgi:hypothetical protein
MGELNAMLDSSPIMFDPPQNKMLRRMPFSPTGFLLDGAATMFGKPLLGAYNGWRQAMGYDQDPNAAKGYVSAESIGRTGMNMAEGAVMGSVFTRAPKGAMRSFAGLNSKTANHAAQKRAEGLEAQGIPRDDIWRETGWGRGVDDKWRYEIDDSGMVGKDTKWGAKELEKYWNDRSYVDPANDLTRQIRDDIRRVTKASTDPSDAVASAKKINKQLVARLDAGDIDGAKRLGGHPYQTFNSAITQRYYSPLSTYYDHPELFKAYPELKNLHTRIDMDGNLLDGNTRGSYQRERPGDQKEQIHLKEMPSKTNVPGRSTALHEVGGHLVQDREGFAQGGNASTLNNYPNKQYETYQKAIKTDPEFIEYRSLRDGDDYARELAANNKLYNEEFAPRIAAFEAEQQALPRGSAERKRISEKMTAIFDEADLSGTKRFPAIRRADELAAKITARGISLHPPPKTLSGFEGYRRLAGEVEARTVQARQKMTAAERRERPMWKDYDVLEEEQIVKYLSANPITGLGANAMLDRREQKSPNKMFQRGLY